MDAIEYIETKMRTVPFTGNEGAKFSQMLDEAKEKKGKASMLNMLGGIFILLGFLGAPLAFLASVPMLIYLSFIGVVGGILLILAYNAKEDFDAAKIYCISYLAAVEARAISTHITTPMTQPITSQPIIQPTQTPQPISQVEPQTAQLSATPPIQSTGYAPQPQVTEVPTTVPTAPIEQPVASIPTDSTLTPTTHTIEPQTGTVSQTQPIAQATQPTTQQPLLTQTQVVQPTQPVTQANITQASQTITQQPTTPTQQTQEEKKEEVGGIYTTAPPATPGTQPWQCGICRGTIKQGLTVILCKCQQPYHDTCGERFGVCVMCGAKLPSKKDKGALSTTQTTQTTTQHTQHTPQQTQPTQAQQPKPEPKTEPKPESKPGPGTVQSEGHTVAQPGQPTVKAGEKKTCAICNGLIKQGLSVVTCACGSIFHAACANRAAECPKCYRKL
ncbi:MAG: hypothetical protein QXT63_02965 [Thermoplasmata archaeon]